MLNLTETKLMKQMERTGVTAVNWGCMGRTGKFYGLRERNAAHSLMQKGLVTLSATYAPETHHGIKDSHYDLVLKLVQKD